ncbi:serine/threonine-protein kinase [Rubrobacter taiwanensis]|jgi:tRNA A-37 threonylcarbamoyl transferase component Bud32|nr:serine/threonine-protein kinase [Rubrobacter taiwanensis]
MRDTGEIRFARRFVLERQLGAGGMARVFLGRDEVLGRRVAVKILYPYYSDTEIGARFRREGRTAARLSHRNIVQVYDAGEAEFEGRQVSYIVMEYLPGGDLKELIQRDGRLPEREVARIGSELAAGLVHAHEHGIVHRDIKPLNVLMDAEGHPKLSDFGIAHALDFTQFTRTGSFLGTALYAPPEQLRGERVTHKSDVYSLGVTLYHAAAGAPPFEGSPLSVARKHESEPPPPPRERGAPIGAELEALILECLEKDPGRRPDAAAVRRRLMEISTPPASRPAAPPPPERPVPREERKRSRRPAVLAGAALVALLVGFGAYALLAGDGFQEAGETRAPAEQAQRPEEPAESAPPEGGPAGAPSTRQEEPEPGAAGREDPETPPEETAGERASPLSAEAAERAVREMYLAAASDDPGSSWDYLSGRFRQQVGSREAWTGQFDTLERIEFLRGPEAEVSGDTARVSFVTLARHTDRTEQNTATWVLISEGGVWKLDELAAIQTRVVES